MCELYEAQVARARYFVNELASAVNSRMKCVTRVMTMPGARRIVADLRMFAWAACDERGPGFVNVSVRTVTNARHVGMPMQSKRMGTNRHPHVGADITSENMERTGTSVHQVAKAMKQQLREDKQELKTREQKRRQRMQRRSG